MQSVHCQTSNVITMKQYNRPALLLLSCLLSAATLFAQPVDSIRFFTDEQPIQMTLTTDIRALQTQKGEDVFQNAQVNMKFPDSTEIEETIGVSARGVFRRGNCRIPPMLLNFRNSSSPQLAPLGKLKLVLGCSTGSDDEELVLKEFVAYKLYNLLESKSFRVRLLRIHYLDSRKKNKPFTQYSFLIEDDSDLARRNGCKKKTHGQYLTEATDRKTMTMVAIFQYMIGNTDWSVPNEHNIKLIFSRENDKLPPFVLPYDFDFCGLVNASYAVPNEIIGTEKVTERVYRGFPRTMEELQETLGIYRNKKSEIISFVQNFLYLPERTRKGMTSYLDEFFIMIENQNKVKSAFIDQARKN